MAPSLMVAAGELDPIRLGHPASCGTSQPAESSITDAYKPRPAEEDPAKTWNPDPRAYYRRKVQQQAVASVPVPLPQGFPEAVDGKCSLVWSGQELTENEYVSQLRPEDINEIEAALKHFKALDLPLSQINKVTFPLPQIGTQIETLSSKLYGKNNGRGFFVLRGLDPKKYCPTDNAIIYAGVSSYVAQRRGRQDECNNYLLHLTDLGSDVAPDNARQSPYSNVPQPFHADTADIIALYTLSTPKSGGRSLLASSGKIYNEIASQYPKHIVELAKNNWAYDTFGRQSAYNIRPLLHSLPGASPLPVLLSFSRRPLTGSPVSTRTEGIPSLTIEQSDALDTVHFTAAAHSIAITQQPGDMQYWNNFALLHAREGFEDCAETGQRRHLMRLWLRDDDKATMCGTDVIPDALKGYWEDAFAEKESEVQGWPTEPIAEKKFVCEQRRSCGHA